MCVFFVTWFFFVFKLLKGGLCRSLKEVWLIFLNSFWTGFIGPRATTTQICELRGPLLCTLYRGFLSQFLVWHRRSWTFSINELLLYYCAIFKSRKIKSLKVHREELIWMKKNIQLKRKSIKILR